MEIPRIAIGTFGLGDDESVDEPICHAIKYLDYRHLDCTESYHISKLATQIIDQKTLKSATNLRFMTFNLNTSISI